jgi:hypothetical protein
MRARANAEAAIAANEPSDETVTTGYECPEDYEPKEAKPVALSARRDREEADLWVDGGKLDVR